MLSAGMRLGPYEILSPLGQGGMGEVYRARDTRLERTVAIKVLSADRAGDAQFRERFEREARAVSSLNHPNICVLHDIGSEGSVAYLVMECLEGEPLAARLERGALPVAEALRYAIEIASARDAAHRCGVVHRDLKPGNIMLTKSGAKLLDFGLAKVRAMSASAGDHTATITVTTEGSIVGTFQYMSPEQLEGREADARSDIFAFGATLYEMLTGKRAFAGASQASLITAIMSAQPAPASSVQPEVPAPLDRVVRRCLAKAPDDRWQSARDLAEELRWIQEGGAGAAAAAIAPTKARVLVPWLVAAVGGLAALAMAAVLLRQEKPAPPAPVRFSVNPPEGVALVQGTRPTVSPDGQWVLFGGQSGDQPQLYLHSLAGGSARAVAGTGSALATGPLASAYWSFDSRSFLVHAGGNSYARVGVNGEPPQTLQLPSPIGYCSWGPRGAISAYGNVYWFAPDGSGVRTVKTVPNAAYASWLPGGDWLLYNQAQGAGVLNNTAWVVHALSLDGKTDRTLGRMFGPAIYAAPGYLLFNRGGVLMAQAMDARRLELKGGPMPLVDHVGAGGQDYLGFSVSDNGVLAFRFGNFQTDTQMVWMDRAGNRLTEVGSAADYSNPALSPDGTRLAVGIRDPATQTRNIWVFDLVRNGATRLTFDPAEDYRPVWSPDGSRIAFVSNRRGSQDLYVKNASGAGEDELLLHLAETSNMEDWSRDGRWIAFDRGLPNYGIWMLSTDTRKAEVFLGGQSILHHARFSPDGRWVAYASTENGRSEVFVRPFAGGTPGANSAGGKWQISTQGGLEPQWREDGKELFFISLNPTRIMAADIAEKDGAIVAGIPHALFPVRVGPGPGDVRNRWLATPDGKKFLVVEVPEAKPLTSFTVILNWPALLKK